MVNQINSLQAITLIQDKSAQVADIRDVNSFNSGHIENAIRLDNDNFSDFVEKADKTKPIIVCCYHGNSSQSVAGILQSMGFDSFSLIGGMSDWSLSSPVVTN